ncbi:DUF6056 family protein [Streptomyces beijiangensis]|uniref:Uncharacterized protein n=1 Tax=Streptomyces beijiangensis TaxID=163361 RepID=A0A939FBX9_9ACTN|nr:DUF6056 family protein [Streptomyces beijiangensis]MBO0515396.1 hypothetical protein [Streptomyces beijiangensis]
MAVDASSVTTPRDPGEEPGKRGWRDRGGDRERRTTSWTALLSLLPLGLLAIACWYGQYVRPSADEWCFLPRVRDQGVSGLVDRFYNVDNGRVANALMVGAYAKFGVAGHQWFGPVSAVIMLAALWILTVLVLRRLGQRVPLGIPLLIALTVSVVFFFACVNIYKTFYWPAASVSHTMAPILAAAVANPLLLAHGRAGRIAALVLTVVGGVFIGTLSEETSMIVLVVGGTIILFAHLFFTERVRGYIRTWAGCYMLGIAVGMVILMTSPGSVHRRQRYGAQSTTDMLSPHNLTVAFKAYAHILVKTMPTWQYLGAVAAGVILGLVVRSAGRRSTALKPVRPLVLAGLGALVCLVSGYLCTVITLPVFGSRATSTDRVWNDWLLLYILLFVGVGVMLGRALRLRTNSRSVTGAATLAAAAVYAGVCLSLVAPMTHLGHQMHVRAEKFDRQDAYLREQAAEGKKTAPYTPTRVGHMLEPFGMKSGWPVQCAAQWYHLDKLTHGTRIP